MMLLILLMLGCRSEPDRSGGSAVHVREHYEGGRLSLRELFEFEQQSAPEDGASFTIQSNRLEAVYGKSQAPARLPRDNTATKITIVAGGMLFIALGGAAFYFGHVRLGMLGALGGGVMIALAMTIERYAWLYASGVLVLGGLMAWLAWSSYRSGQKEAP